MTVCIATCAMYMVGSKSRAETQDTLIFCRGDMNKILFLIYPLVHVYKGIQNLFVMKIIDKTSDKGYPCIRIENLSIIDLDGMYEVAQVCDFMGSTVIYGTNSFAKLYKFVSAYLDS